jgi:MFS family permease
VVFAGIFLGAYAWGIVSDIHGRRLGFIATALFTFLFGMLRYMTLSLDQLCCCL